MEAIGKNVLSIIFAGAYLKITSQTHLNLFMLGIHKWTQLEKTEQNIRTRANATTGRTGDRNCTSMQKSGRSLAITCIRSSKGSNVRLSEGVYGPQATKIFTGSVITDDEIYNNKHKI